MGWLTEFFQYGFRAGNITGLTYTVTPMEG